MQNQQLSCPISRQTSIPTTSSSLTTSYSFKQRPPMCESCEKSLPNQIVFNKIESILKNMQDEHNGVPVKTAKSFRSKIPSVFTGVDLILWMMKNMKLEEQEALHLAGLIASHGYIFPIEDHTLSMKNDCTFYRFQTPCLWPSNNSEPENTEYAVYLCKRTMQGKTRLELADYEAENLARLQKMFSRKWEFIFMQAESQAKVDKKRDKLERKVLDSQERAFWDVYRPVPGCVNTTELDIKKVCRLSNTYKRCPECLKICSPHRATTQSVTQVPESTTTITDESSTVCDTDIVATDSAKLLSNSLTTNSEQDSIHLDTKSIVVEKTRRVAENISSSGNDMLRNDISHDKQKEGIINETFSKTDIVFDKTVKQVKEESKEQETSEKQQQSKKTNCLQKDRHRHSSHSFSNSKSHHHHTHQHGHHHSHGHSHGHHHHHHHHHQKNCPHYRQQETGCVESMLGSGKRSDSRKSKCEKSEQQGDTSKDKPKDISKSHQQETKQDCNQSTVDDDVKKSTHKQSQEKSIEVNDEKLLSSLPQTQINISLIPDSTEEKSSTCYSVDLNESDQDLKTVSPIQSSSSQQPTPTKVSGLKSCLKSNTDQTKQAAYSNENISSPSRANQIINPVACTSSSLNLRSSPDDKQTDIGILEKELESLKTKLDKKTGGFKMSKVTQSYLSYFKQWAEYDPFIAQPIPSNPWVSDSTELWDLERQTKNVHCRRVKRWAFSLKELLNDPAGREQFHKFLEKEFSAENLKFWDAVQELKFVHSKDVACRVEAIWTEYLAPDANCPINIDSKSYETSKRNMTKNKNNRYIFDEAAGHVYQLMKNDSYPRYLRSDMYKDYKEASEKKRPNQVAFDVFKPQITTLKHKFNF